MNKSLALFLIFTFLVASFLIAVQPIRAAIGLIEDSWVKKSSMPQGGAVFGAAVVNGKIYAFGGYRYNGTLYSTTGEYDPATDTWTKKALMPTPRTEFATVAYENKIYLIGGMEDDAFPLNTVEVYDPATNSWTAKASMPTSLGRMQAHLVNGKIYVIGGIFRYPVPDGVSDATKVYDPRSDSWSSAASIPNPVYGYASAVIDDKIYVMAGCTPSGSLVTNTNHIYDPLADKWTLGAPLPKAVGGASAGATTGAVAPKGIYVIGGGLNQVYNPETNSWINGSKVPYEYSSVVTVLNDTLYMMGGTYSATIPSGSGKLYPPEANPPPPFSAVNYQYVPFGYGTFNPIPTPSPSPSPTPTGLDNSSLVIAVVLVAITCALVAAIVIKRRKRPS